MFIDGGLADTHAMGNLLEGDAIVEVLHDDITADGRLQLVYTLMQGFHFFFEPFCRHDGRVEIKEVKAFHLFLYLSATHHVHTSVSYACKQIGLGCLFPKIDMVIEQSDEDVVHYIFALCIIVQIYVGQPIHLTIMLFEQFLEFPFICHTIIIHAKIDLLNPKWHLFSKLLYKMGFLHLT